MARQQMCPSLSVLSDSAALKSDKEKCRQIKNKTDEHRKKSSEKVQMRNETRSQRY